MKHARNKIPSPDLFNSILQPSPDIIGDCDRFINERNKAIKYLSKHIKNTGHDLSIDTQRNAIQPPAELF